MRGLPQHEATVPPAEPISPGQGERTSAAFVSFLRLGPSAPRPLGSRRAPKTSTKSHTAIGRRPA
jgi:hypothetical protein